ncbi:MAG: type II toxin-antitoxin system Phd/YefM family antitoxin [Candidatus Parabeggiatoa sp.]|nr:type II toxin-antitoxin system Phd/YefM family antitoxin [Candidatus Parabeggiatoa sp.]
MNAVTVNHAAQNLNHLIGQVISNVEPTIICNDEGERALLMSMDEFNSWQETLYLLSNPANAEHLRESIAQVALGKTQERELIEP